MKKLLLAFSVALLAMTSPALAQNPATVKLCTPTSGTACATVTATAPLPVTGTFSATLSGFTPNGNYGTLTATAASSASTALPAGAVVAFQNTSTVDVSCVLSAGAATATTNKIVVRGGASVFLTVGSNVNAACINQTGSASNVIVMAGGTGLGTNFGGGGGAGAVTIADGADVALGAVADAAATAGSTGTVSAKLRYITTQLDELKTAVEAAIPAGTNLIGDVNLRQGGTALSATNGTYTNLLVGNAAVATGTGAQGATTPRFTVATDQATNAGAALKNGGVGVVNGASSYQHVAASATNTVLGATGAAGDYLSHCVIYPGTTGAGSVTVFDNTNSAANIVIEFTSGTLSNLAPIPVPVGAVSTGGAWKITTGTNVTVACFGKFT